MPSVMLLKEKILDQLLTKIANNKFRNKLMKINFDETLDLCKINLINLSESVFLLKMDFKLMLEICKNLTEKLLKFDFVINLQQLIWSVVDLALILVEKRS